MKGLLHRLAARATGTAATLHSNARLPYGGGAFEWGEAGDSEGGPGAPVRGRSSEVWEAAVETPQHREPAATRRQPEPPTLMAPRATAPTGAAVLPSDERSERFASRARPLVDGVPAPGAPAEDPSAHPKRPAGRAPIEATAPLATTTRLEVRETGFAFPRGKASLDDDLPAPLPLMPGSEAPPAVRSMSPLTPTPGTPAAGRVELRAVAATQSDDSSEVHIHIGRIDVTAVHDAPPPRRRPAPAAPAPMSLDDYLSARQRGRS